MTQPYFTVANVIAGFDTTGYRIRVYDEKDNLICWCGPYLKTELERHVAAWEAGGWVRKPKKGAK